MFRAVRRGFSGRLTFIRATALVVIATIFGVLSGCGAIVSSAASGMADSISSAILEQEDPELVREGIPTFLLLLDSMVASSPDNPALLGGTAKLYAAYGAAFVSDEQRAKILTGKAHELGKRALCASDSSACDLEKYVFDDYAHIIRALGNKSADALHSYAISSLAYIRTHSDDWVAMADLPKIEVALEHLLELDSGEKAGSVNMYLGILNSLRPPALGGRPERGQQYFETAIGLTGGKDLNVKVEYARGYARLVYDRELHDQLLNEVLASEVKQTGYTLGNSLARKQAEELLASADDYF